MVIESTPSATKIERKGAEGTQLKHKHERIDATAQLEPNKPSILLKLAELEHEEREGAEIESMPSATKIKRKGAEGTQLEPEHYDRIDATADLEPNKPLVMLEPAKLQPEEREGAEIEPECAEGNNIKPKCKHVELEPGLEYVEGTDKLKPDPLVTLELTKLDTEPKPEPVCPLPSKHLKGIIRRRK